MLSRSKSNEHPILFSSENINAILNGRKIQTRRIIKPPPGFLGVYDYRGGSAHPYCFLAKNGIWDCFRTIDELVHRYCPYGWPGSTLWVRETWAESDHETIVYKADQPFGYDPKGGKWKPSIFMPRSASRISLKVLSVRIESLLNLSEEDAIAEGVIKLIAGSETVYITSIDYSIDSRSTRYDTAIDAFKSIWQSIHGVNSWYENPWVWRIKFKVISPKNF